MDMMDSSSDFHSILDDHFDSSRDQPDLHYAITKQRKKPAPPPPRELARPVLGNQVIVN